MTVPTLWNLPYVITTDVLGGRHLAAFDDRSDAATVGLYFLHEALLLRSSDLDAYSDVGTFHASGMRLKISVKHLIRLGRK